MQRVVIVWTSVCLGILAGLLLVIGFVLLLIRRRQRRGHEHQSLLNDRLKHVDFELIERRVLPSQQDSIIDRNGMPVREKAQASLIKPIHRMTLQSSLPDLTTIKLINDDASGTSRFCDSEFGDSLDHVFMQDFGSNLGYRVFVPPITSWDETAPKIPLQKLDLPEDASSSDVPNCGLVIAELDLKWPIPKRSGNQLVLKVIVHEVHCILKDEMGVHHLNSASKSLTKPGKFYVKARLTRKDASDANSSTFSLLSLDQLSRLSGTGDARTQFIAGKTPIRCGLRSITFKHCIMLPVPLHWIDYDESDGCLPLDLRLKLDLKQCQQSDRVSLLNMSKVVASTEVNLNSQIWKFLQQKDILSLDLDENDNECSPDPGEMEPNRLMFAKPLIPRHNQGQLFCSGQLSLALQWHRAEARLSLRLIAAELHVAHKGISDQVFARCTLLQNQQLIRSFDTDKSLSINTISDIQFPLDNNSTISLKYADEHPDLNKLCLLIVLISKSKPHAPSVPLGRCVVGGPGLAYGSGLKQWQNMCHRSGEVIRGTHCLF